MRKFRWRTNYLNHPKFQFSLIGFNMIVSMTIIVCFYVENYFLFLRFWPGSSSMNEVDVAAGISPSVAQNLLTFAFTVTSLCSLLALFAGGLYISNRVAGPIIRLRKYLDSINTLEDIKPLSFRKNDYFQEIPEAFNAAMNRIKNSKDRK